MFVKWGEPLVHRAVRFFGPPIKTGFSKRKNTRIPEPKKKLASVSTVGKGTVKGTNNLSRPIKTDILHENYLPKSSNLSLHCTSDPIIIHYLSRFCKRIRKLYV